MLGVNEYPRLATGGIEFDVAGIVQLMRPAVRGGAGSAGCLCKQPHRCQQFAILISAIFQVAQEIVLIDFGG